MSLMMCCFKISIALQFFFKVTLWGTVMGGFKMYGRSLFLCFCRNFYKVTRNFVNLYLVNDIMSLFVIKSSI